MAVSCVSPVPKPDASARTIDDAPIRPATCSARTAAMSTATGNEKESSPLPPPVAAASSHDDGRSAIVPPPVTSSGNETLLAIPPTVHVPADPTRSATPTSSPELQPLASSPLRSPERYHILGEHGRGGIGRVSRAHDRELGRDVAIKELISRGRLSEARFLREALITARLEHPGVVPVHEAGRWPDGTPFYAMKLVSGRPLRDLIAERSTVDKRIGLLHHVIAVADAIAYAHGRNIIHRDLKPANVIVGDFGETIVIDWGLAKDLSVADEPAIDGDPFLNNHDHDLTVAGAILGTPTYMAPEQERGEHVDQRADVFAIGAMLWELCSLQRVPPTNLRLRHRLLRRAGIDSDLAAIVDKGLHPDRMCRYPNAGALASDLKAFKTGARISARRYSLWAMLVHWMRHRRALAASVAITVAMALFGGILYVHNISAERDRTASALQVARRDLDRAQLAEASLLFEKDPTSARDLLDKLPITSPQYALLRNRSSQAAARRAIQLPSLGRLLMQPATREVAVVMLDGLLASVDVDAGRLRRIDDGLLGAVSPYRQGWLYARRLPTETRVTITSSSEPRPQIDAGALLTDITDQLVTNEQVMYALNKNDLYHVDGTTWSPVKHGVRSFAANETLLITCSTNNDLEVARRGEIVRRGSCAKAASAKSLAVAGSSYAVVQDSKLLLVRKDATIELPLQISGSHELVLADSGLLAIADLSDKPWYVAPGDTALKVGPAHASLPIAAAADGRFAAWGYADGTVVALDTATHAVWSLRGHNSRVTSIVIDEHQRLLSSIAGMELRIWALSADERTEISGVPCTVYTLALSKEQDRAAIDCLDGRVRVWSLSTGAIEVVHQHKSVSFSVAWWRDNACSGGFDGKVLCTSPAGDTRELLSTSARIQWLEASPDRRRLVIATSDGKIQEFDGNIRTLYSHDAPPYRMAFSMDGQWLASGADDGSVLLYDFEHHRLHRPAAAHTARVMSVAWRDHDLLTSGADGALLRWAYRDDNFRPVERNKEPGAFRFLRLLRDGWIGNIDSHVLLVHRMPPATSLRLDLGRRVMHLETSPDSRFIAATLSGEIILLDLFLGRVASMNIASDGIGYVGFPVANVLAISTPNGFYTIDPLRLSYTSLY
jgi:eukaryotic-like serine/threonine-protein kinase